jgi:hypothetical protein
MHAPIFFDQVSKITDAFKQQLSLHKRLLAPISASKYKENENHMVTMTCCSRCIEKGGRLEVPKREREAESRHSRTSNNMWENDLTQKEERKERGGEKRNKAAKTHFKTFLPICHVKSRR